MPRELALATEAPTQRPAGAGAQAAGHASYEQTTCASPLSSNWLL